MLFLILEKHRISTGLFHCYLFSLEKWWGVGETQPLRNESHMHTIFKTKQNTTQAITLLLTIGI